MCCGHRPSTKLSSATIGQPITGPGGMDTLVDVTPRVVGDLNPSPHSARPLQLRCPEGSFPYRFVHRLTPAEFQCYSSALTWAASSTAPPPNPCPYGRSESTQRALEEEYVRRFVDEFFWHLASNCPGFSSQYATAWLATRAVYAFDYFQCRYEDPFMEIPTVRFHTAHLPMEISMEICSPLYRPLPILRGEGRGGVGGPTPSPRPGGRAPSIPRS